MNGTQPIRWLDMAERHNLTEYRMFDGVRKPSKVVVCWVLAC